MCVVRGGGAGGTFLSAQAGRASRNSEYDSFFWPLVLYLLKIRSRSVVVSLPFPAISPASWHALSKVCPYHIWCHVMVALSCRLASGISSTSVSLRHAIARNPPPITSLIASQIATREIMLAKPPET